MAKSRISLTTLRQLSMSKDEIRALDPLLFSDEEKNWFIEQLHGGSSGVVWRRELQSATNNLKRWSGPWQRAGSAPFRVSHDDLVDLATRHPCKDRQLVVTSFTDWLFRLYVPDRDVRRLLIGTRIEKEILALRIPSPSHSRWKLIYDGTADSGSQSLPISALDVDGALTTSPRL